MRIELEKEWEKQNVICNLAADNSDLQMFYEALSSIHQIEDNLRSSK